MVEVWQRAKGMAYEHGIVSKEEEENEPHPTNYQKRTQTQHRKENKKEVKESRDVIQPVSIA